MRFILPFITFLFTLGNLARAEQRPNIIFLLADDLRWNALHHAGNPVVETPNIDTLAAGGVRFTQCFVTTSICSVSRASLFSGQYARRHGIEDFDRKFTPEQWKETYPALLRAAGYHTGFIGKFGVGNAASIAAMEKGFDFWRGRPGQGGLFIDPKDPTRTHATARFGEEALEFLRAAPADRPLCLSISFTAPHARDGRPREFEPDARDETLYAQARIPVPAKATEKLFQLLPEAARNSEGRKRWELRFNTPERFQQTTRDYLRLVTGIDREIGRIRQLVEERGLAQNTVFIFTSDNGFFFGERGLADKWLMYEESIRVPLIVRDPRLPKTRWGTVVDQIVLNIDVAPTLLNVAGIKAPERMQGRSLLPLMAGNSAEDWRNDFFYEHHFGEKRNPPIPAVEGVREERWKYARWTSTEPVFEELFDLQTDPEELVNLAADEAQQEQLMRLRGRWKLLAETLH